MIRIPKVILTVLIVLLCQSFIYSQDALKTANSLYKNEHFRNAIPYYEDVLKKSPNNVEALFKSGVCYLNRFSKEKALENILKAYNSDSTVNKHIRYWMGRAYHLNYKFDEAEVSYKIYKNSLRKKDQRSEDLRIHLEQTQKARELYNAPKNYVVLNLGETINSTFSDHSPVISSDNKTLYYTSRREGGADEKEELDGEPFEDILVATRNDDGTWGKPESVHLNTTGHDASCQLYDNDSKMVIYKFHRGGDIYHCDKEGNKWSEPKIFANINTKKFESSAFVTADGNTIYFSSNRYKKNEDLDIYYVKKLSDGTWSKIQEIKGPVNTKFDEDAPFISPDGKTMYFSSRGLKNMGGFDVFKSTVDANGIWSEPENLGYPINTPDDDVYYYLSANGKRGYIASYRSEGLGEKDIYEIIPILNVNIKGLVTEDVTGKQINGVTVLFIPQKKAGDSASDASKEDGSFGVSVPSYNTYKIAVMKGSDTLKTEILDVPVNDDENKIITKNIVLPYTPPAVVDSVKADTVKKVDPVVVVTKQFSYKTLYYVTGRADLNNEGRAELDKLAKDMKENSTLQVQLIGHTDEIGSDAFNQQLSEKRAKAALDYVVRKGISAKRLTSKGFGESAPAVPNDSDENRQLNRRTEIKVTAQ